MPFMINYSIIKVAITVFCTISFLNITDIFAQNNVNLSPATESIESTSLDKEKPVIDPDFQKILEESKQNTTENNLKDDVKIEQIEITKQEVPAITSPAKEAVQKYPRTKYELFAFYLFGVIFLITNFVCSALLPKYRYLFIGVPFDIGVKEEKTDPKSIVKSKRNFIELFLLIIAAFILFFAGSYGKLEPNEDILRELIFGSELSFLLYLGYLIIRLLLGFNSKCPKCKNMFAVETTTWNEPKTTYTKTLGGGSNQINSYETGVVHFDHECNVCDHQWHTARSYTRSKGKA